MNDKIKPAANPNTKLTRP